MEMANQKRTLQQVNIALITCIGDNWITNAWLYCLAKASSKVFGMLNSADTSADENSTGRPAALVEIVIIPFA
ncbi:unnamed protein product [Acanthoscelides obtectus]|uniref:Uncharacterized protein n=1 Tax=Acanthoscelides obtectus TaxID=200917 RepID=A0A9P0PVU0_ACAOB|nr:unnamed protein product [Acanthoscelides obtectus]CAK1636157.1 hypothetical protein AOBTE_LOCUS9767 [Acanthoscelides obtectus]